jgi:hypothetical protein
MKHLFLCAIACLLLCTACFEKEDEKIQVVPSDFNIEDCERLKNFITRDPTGIPKEPRATVKKYLKGNEYIFETNTGGSTDNNDLIIIAYWNTGCEVLCNITLGGTMVDTPCSQGFLDSLVYIETVWTDER